MTKLAHTIVQTATGEARELKGWLRTQIALNPLSWTVGALVLGFALGAMVF